MRSLLFLTALTLTGCGRGASTPPTTTPSASETEATGPSAPAPASKDASAAPAVPAADPVAAPTEPAKAPATAPSSARELYESCEARLEQPEAEGECKTDDDCVKAGCSSEVCTTASAAAELMSTCEVLPCFSVLDTCGCVEGRCRWSITDAAPAGLMPPLMLPQ